MRPVAAVIGSRQSLGEVEQRLRLHGCDAAPVVQDGELIGLIDRTVIADAIRFGLTGLTAGDLVTRPGPRISSGAPFAQIVERSRTVSPGLLVVESGVPVGMIMTAPLQRQAGPEALRGSILKHFRQRLDPFLAFVLRTSVRIDRIPRLRPTIVGGPVRDALLGRDFIDLDLAVEGNPEPFGRRLARAIREAGRVVEVAEHPGFRTLRISVAGFARIDINMCRREIYKTAGALPEVYRGTLIDDLRRRDITLNSLGLTLDARLRGFVVDPLGGRRDLRARRLVVNTPLAFVEDPTRAFRVARFASRLRFNPSESTRRALDFAIRASTFRRVSGDRIYREFARFIEEPDPLGALDAMARLDLLGVLVPDLRYEGSIRSSLRRLLDGIRRGPLREARDSAPLLVLLVLASRSGESGRVDAAAQAGLRGRFRELLLTLGEESARLTGSLRRGRKASAIARSCRRASAEVLAVAWATGDATVRARLDRYLTRDRHVRVAVTGARLRALGVPEGPAFGDILDRLRDARIDGKIRREEDEIRLARRLARPRLPSPRGGRGST